MKKLSLNVQKEDVFDLIKGLLIALFFSVVFVVLFAVIVKYAGIGDKAIAVVNIVLKIVSVLLGCMIGFKHPKNGALKGLLTGILFILLTFLIFSLTNGGFEKGALTVWDVLAGALTGVISGIIAVNVRGR